MVEVCLEREFDVDSGKPWAILADFGDIGWIPSLEKVELEGEGVGMIRHVTAPGMPMLHERMDAIDREQMILDYSVPAVEYLRTKNHRARARVVALAGGRCRLVWSCETEADGVSEADATANCQAFYEMVLGWIGEALAK
jgi:hypothetical protein